MIRYKGGNVAQQGIYWDRKNSRSMELSASGILPGNASSTYIRIPAVVMVLAAPIVGLLFIVLLPFAWMAALAGIAAKQGAVGLFRAAVRSASFGWRPVEAYLAGRRKGRKPD